MQTATRTGHAATSAVTYLSRYLAYGRSPERLVRLHELDRREDLLVYDETVIKGARAEIKGPSTFDTANSY